MENFKGALRIYNFEGTLLGDIVVINGKPFQPENNKLNIVADVINSFNTSKNSTNKVPACNDIDTIAVYEETLVDYYNVWTTASGTYITTVYSHTVSLGVKVTYMAVAYDCGQAGDSYHMVHREPRYEYNSERIPITEADFKANIRATTPNAWDFELVQNQNTVTAKATFLLLPWCGVKVFIDESKTTNYNVQNVTSDAFGLTIGYSWNQNTYNQSTNGTVTTVNVFGTLSYTAFVQGIGTFYSKPMTLQIKINNTNGTIISGTRLP